MAFSSGAGEGVCMGVEGLRSWTKGKPEKTGADEQKVGKLLQAVSAPS